MKGLLVLLAVLALLAVATRDPMPPPMAYSRVTIPGQISEPIRGSSMVPSIRSGDRVVYDTLALNKIEPGHILLFRWRDPEGIERLSVHRVAWAWYDDVGWYAVTTGDNTRMFDRHLVRANEVLGVVRAVVYGYWPVD